MNFSRFFLVLFVALSSLARAAQSECVTTFPIILEVAAANKSAAKYGHHEFKDCPGYYDFNIPYACTNNHRFYFTKVTDSYQNFSTNYSASSYYYSNNGYTFDACEGIQISSNRTTTLIETNRYDIVECCGNTLFYTGTNVESGAQSSPCGGVYLPGGSEQYVFTSGTSTYLKQDGAWNRTWDGLEFLTNRTTYTTYFGVTNSPYILTNSALSTNHYDVIMFRIPGDWVTNSFLSRTAAISGDDDVTNESLSEEYTTDLLLDNVRDPDVNGASWQTKGHDVAFLRFDDAVEHSATGRAFKYRFRLPNTVEGREYRFEWYIELTRTNGAMYVERRELSVVGTGSEVLVVPTNNVALVPALPGDRRSIERITPISATDCVDCATPGALKLDEDVVGMKLSLGKTGLGTSAGNMLISAGSTDYSILGPKTDLSVSANWLLSPQAAMRVSGSSSSRNYDFFGSNDITYTNGGWTNIHPPSVQWVAAFSLTSGSTDGSGTQTLTRYQNSVAVESYQFGIATGDWNRVRDDGVVTMNEWANVNGAGHFTMTQLPNIAAAADYELLRTYSTQQWGGRVLTFEKLNDYSNPRTNTFEYYNSGTPDWMGGGYTVAPLKHSSYYDGFWEHFAYASDNGLVIAHYKPLKDGTFDDGPTEATSYYYDTQDFDADDLSILPEIPRYTVTTWGAYHQQLNVISNGQIDTYVATNLRMVFTVDDADALLTSSSWITSGRFATKVWRVINPDGTMSLTSYATNGYGQIVTTNWVGKPMCQRPRSAME